ncbi:polysaccharide deacetylase family protein [Marinospirillum alkaliphilum]|uniref:Polysaccharide deacetylase n=1 Tax=Marinospirillum alkaliphilum DSM 21637 TaxID=1122209 RepID=A0A1K1VGF5_9GAMM|nr:polysaccharide deacetylase family protein [Marinospirillum alkaliphilum]SFX23796.1 Polysaccharide deacetylase [Marinospirillum alkaliphilum DSM 21637]
MSRLFLLLILLTGFVPLSKLQANQPAEVADRFHASILMYHHISSRTPPSTSTSPQRFREHLDLLERDGFQVWPLDRVVQHLQRRRPMPDRVAVITFDDGYISVYENALPLLKERGLPFTIFVNAQPINERHPLHMSWAQLKEAKEAGGIIANHTLTHPHMIRKEEGETDEQWLERLTHEIVENQREIEKHLGETPRYLAYPYGEYTPEIQELVRRLGYVGFGQQSGPASPFTGMTAIPRYAANGIFSNPTTLRTKLHAVPFPLLSEEPVSTVLAGRERRPTLTLTLAPGDYRLRQLACYGPDAQVLPVRTRTLENGNVVVTVNSDRDLSTGRPRYNCTAPHATENRFFWFSRQWLLPHPDGTWYDF